MGIIKMNNSATIVFLSIVLIIIAFTFSTAIINIINGQKHELQKKLDSGIITNKRIVPEWRLETDGKKIDTIFVYKQKQ